MVSSSYGSSSSRQLLLFVLVGTSVPLLVDGTPASRTSFTSSYPDGQSTGLHELLMGTPEYHFTIVEKDEDGWYATTRNEEGYPVYAILGSDGSYEPTTHVVGSEDLPPQESFMAVESQDVQTQKCLANEYCTWKLDHNGQYERTFPPKMKNLVIPLRFADHVDDRTKITEAELETQLYNDAELSVQDYFLKQSHGQFELTSTVVPWYEISKTEAECANGQSGLSTHLMACLKEALDAAMQYVKIEEYDSDGNGQIDSLTFVHSGYGAEYGSQDNYYAHYTDRIWSHAWELTGVSDVHDGTRYALHSAHHGIANQNVARVGIAVHEIAQMLGFPTTYGQYPGVGLGYYDIMSNPYGFDGTQYTCGNMAAPSKLHMGWLTVVDITQDGEFTIETTSEGTANAKTVYKISKNFDSGEYLLIENRQALGYDGGLRQSGLAIYHIDEAGGDEPGYPANDNSNNYPTNGKHYRHSLIQADGEFELEKGKDFGDSFDLFHGGYVNGITPSGPIVVEIDHEEVVQRGRDLGYPNTKSYQDGRVGNTGITIKDISESATEMTFTVTFDTSTEG
mmetsp:Transcript_25633/g.36142  ORF Transcript_25633/g.36142 Transcript_25633/m.36142 type:complete len:565 (+) Transcript_25633:99-1793(+)